MATAADSEVRAIAGELATLGRGRRSRLVEASWWSERMLDWAISHPSFKTQLFRFVDVFPATTGDRDVLRHLEEYFELAEVPKAVDLGLGVAEHLPFGAALSAALARNNIANLAGQFIVGTTPNEAVEGLHELWKKGCAFTVDVLGEKIAGDVEADRYASRVEDLVSILIEGTGAWSPDELLDSDDTGSLPRVNVSVKPSALSAHYAPLCREDGIEEATSRLLPILAHARHGAAYVHLDTEHYDSKELTFDLLHRLVANPDLAGVHLGTTVQAYLKDSYADLADLIALSKRRGSPPLTVRLVKGAYWDSETITSQAAGWPVPVFEAKEQTDANFERCARLLHDEHGSVRAAFGSHNLRSLAYAIAYARAQGIADCGYELQMLYGMGQEIQLAARNMGLRLRVYSPVGELVPGMAYLVRRLLENTANESFIRRRVVDGEDLENLVQAPPVTSLPEPEAVPRRLQTDPDDPGHYRHEPTAEWRRREVRSSFGDSLLVCSRRGLGIEVPAVIDDEKLTTTANLDSTDPARPGVVVARSSSCGSDEVEAAIEAARRAWPGWSRTSPTERASVLFGAAQWMRARRFEIAALEVFEAGKPWDEADADVCESIDFCEYYGRRMIDMANGAPVQSPPGEANSMHYQPRGIGAVISPWNFPLAIATGMVTAALVTGNAVLFKPAEQTPATASKLVEALSSAGLPRGALAFLPGTGETVGAPLVRHPEIAFVAFTGSKEVGLEILEEAAVVRPGQRHLKHVIAEMGGKNAIVVDADADLDEAVPIVVSSAFGFSGQKCSACSRVITIGAVHDELVERLAGCARGLRIGHPREMGTQIGPLIDSAAVAKVSRYVNIASVEGEIVLRRGDLPDEGHFFGPTIVTGLSPDARVATDEIFGPVLGVLRASTLDEAIAIANATDYALTAGIVSRSPRNIERATQELRAGNVYVNRPITGAVVGRQPFGGYGLSGTGGRAGGPDYLLEFVHARSVSENTMRQGFAPEGPNRKSRSGV